jgi:[CysO sulfur-carrier protein]-S-L-cysteine hydrolase
MNNVTVTRGNFTAIQAQAEREYPYECCGFVIGGPAGEEVRPIANIQNEKHAANSAAHPRDGRTAYLMDPRQQLAVLNEIDRRGLQLRIVYHSHPDHDAYFSPTDRRQACAFDPDEPDYPDTAYVVLSIREGRLNRAAAFVWDGAARDFVETELVLI